MSNNKPDINLLKNFTSEEYSQIETIFNNYDKNNDGFLEKIDILDIIHTLGVTDIEEEDLDEFLYFLFSFNYTNTKLENVKNISFIDFLNWLSMFNFSIPGRISIVKSKEFFPFDLMFPSVLFIL